jgi:hypothetical protein
MDTKQHGGAARAINATLGPLQRFDQIRTLALATFAIRQATNAAQ